MTNADTSITDAEVHSAICALLDAHDGSLGGLVTAHMVEGDGYFAQLIADADRDRYGVTDAEIVGAVMFSPPDADESAQAAARGVGA